MTTAPAAPRPKTILVADDHEGYRDTIRILLEQNAFRVIDAPNGKEALKILREQTPDLVILDMHMPEKNGFETLGEIRSAHATRKLPVIMVTGSPNLSQIHNMFLDVSDLLHKSTPLDRLLGSIEKALTGFSGSGHAHHQKITHPSAGQDQAKEANPPLDQDASSDLLEFIDPEEHKQQEPSIHQLEILANDSPVIKLVNQILLKAAKSQASDIHMEPQDTQMIVRFRINGALRHIQAFPIVLQPRVAARIKILSSLIVTERRLPQDGQFQANIRGQKIEFRVSILPSLHGEKIVIRLLGQGKVKNNLQAMGLNFRDLDCVKKAIRSPHGLVLVTGPTGSGKTTTLYTMISVLNQEDVNIMTAEDPVEYRLPGVNQVPIKPAIGLTFQAVLRSFLRQDPDVMLIGEIRDLETAEIAAKASITGHLVFSTLHTNSAAATITRMINMGLAPYMVTASVKLVIAQRLIRVLCPKCKEPASITEEETSALAKKEMENMASIFKAKGCHSCHMSGYTGRKPIMEVMPVSSPKMRQIILTSQDAGKLSKQAAKEGMTTLRLAALDAVYSEETSLQEALRILLSD